MIILRKTNSIIIICLLTIGCTRHLRDKTNLTTEKFNFKRFTQLKQRSSKEIKEFIQNNQPLIRSDSGEISFPGGDFLTEAKFNLIARLNDTLANGSIISYGEAQSGYQTILKMPDSKYIVSKQYFKDNLKLEHISHSFGQMLVGLTLFYDHSGKLIRQINEDSLYKFTLDDVAAKIKATYHLDLYKDEKVSIIKYLTDTHLPYYAINIKDRVDHDPPTTITSSEYYKQIDQMANLRAIKTKTIEIDGVSGNIIRETPFQISIRRL